jgi:hypothetical protein
MVIGDELLTEGLEVLTDSVGSVLAGG